MSTTEQLVTGVDFVAVPTGDLAAAVEFYGDVLGPAALGYMPERNFAEFETGTVTLNVMDPVKMGVGELKPEREPARAPRGGRGRRRAPPSAERGVQFQGEISTPASATWRSSPTRTGTR